ncbi:hypothetical protein BDV96DRAFT_662065 [Lophiotrema nucula]|uniref:SET domain-containing protein n=1 Tax=Lophiotrema nucula TaxID=690887 RepID=A0A6A5Z2V6_9PLEO|nr:hypothetical protein BDV96DRAFT_662065 [Lophiotrema nucula]
MADPYLDPFAYATLENLSAIEQEARARPHDPVTPRFKIEHHLDKIRIVNSLHAKIFFVKDADGYPRKLDVPANWKHAVGIEHHFDAKDWKGLARPVGRGFEGMEWPPRDVESLLWADEGACVGCLVKAKYAEDESVTLYAAECGTGSYVVYWDGEGYCVGIVEHNIKSREVLTMQDETEDQETSKKRKRSGQMKRGKKAVEVPWLALLIQSKDPALKPCSCNLEVWKNREEKWYERFELRNIDSNTVGVFALRYLPADHVVGETVGILLPDESEFSVPGETERLSSLTETSFESIADEIKHRWPITLGRPNDPSTAIFAYIENYVFGNFTRFVRHSCNPNAQRKECRLGNRRMNVLISIRAIAKDEEVTEDLGYDYVRAVGACDCGSDRCWLRKQAEENDMQDSSVPPGAVQDLSIRRVAYELVEVETGKHIDGGGCALMEL